MCSKESNSLHGVQRRDLLLSTGKSESYMNGQYVALIETCLVYGLCDRLSGIRLFFWTDLVQFV